MSFKTLTLPILLVLITALTGFSQEEQEKRNDTWTQAKITDDMTVDSVQNRMWREGQYYYSARPKNAWEIGAHIGHFQINGDVPSDPWSGFGVGLHIRKAINYVFSWRLDAMYSNTKGLDGRMSNTDWLELDNHTVDLSAYDGTAFGTYRNFHTKTITGGASVVVNVGNLLFHKERNKWNFYTAVGVSISQANVHMDYFDGDNQDVAYDWSTVEGVFEKNNREKRKAIREILDGEYESIFENDRDVTSVLFDNGEFFPSFTGSMGISRKFNKRFNIGIEHQLFAQDYDKWDGHEWRSAVDQTNDSDLGHYTHLRVGINLGDFDNITEPLYWLNPIDNTLNDIAELKQRPELDLSDEDGDGVIDMLDQELDTPIGAPVDTRGVALDSDGDGLADYLDDEPYSPPGYEINDKGIANVPNCEVCTEEQVINIINKHLGASACGEWFLPMINFDLDKYYVKPENYTQLHHVAEVLNYCPDLKVVAYGHTDVRRSNQYNLVLSFNRATAAKDYLVNNYDIDENRIMVMYGGEDAPIIPNLPDHHNISKEIEMQQYINRRVEFRVAKNGDHNMERPEGPDAGQGTPSSSRDGSKYSGNKNSGY